MLIVIRYVDSIIILLFGRRSPAASEIALNRDAIL